MKKGKNSWRDLFINKSFDLLIVIAGLTIAFELNSLKEDYDDRSLEKFYMESMLSDLQKDLQEYKDNLDELRTDHKLALSGLKKLKSSNDADSLAFTILNIMSRKTFEGHRNTYTTILNGNGLTLIQNADIRNMILDHYRLYAAIERFESNYNHVILRSQDYFIDRFDYGSSAADIIDKHTVENIQTTNLLTLAVVQLQGGIWRYEESIGKAEKLKESITAYVDN